MEKSVIRYVACLVLICWLAPPAWAEGAKEHFQKLAQQLEELSKKDARSDSVEPLQWCPPSKEAPKELLRESESPKLRALAALCIATAKKLEDVAAIEVLLQDNRSAIFFPTVILTQQVQINDPVSWEKRTVAQVALEALSRMIGVSFLNVEHYQIWRKGNPNLELSFDYWEKKLQNSIDSEPLKELKRHPELFLRVVLMGDAWNAPNFGVKEAELSSFVHQHLNQSKLLRLLKQEETWPEFQNEERYDNFSQWILAHASSFFDQTGRKNLLKMWEKDRSNIPLGSACATLFPKKSRAILKRTLEASQSEEILYELARKHLDEEFALIKKWFEEKDYDYKAAVVRAIGTAGHTKLPLLIELIEPLDFQAKDVWDSKAGEFIASLKEVALQFGASAIDLETGELFYLRPFKGYPQTKEEERQVETRKSKVVNERNRCFSQVKRWLLQNRIPPFYPQKYQFRFEDFSVTAVSADRPQALDLASHPKARLFRTNLGQAAKGVPNFAGHYIVAMWGCGSNCADIALIDAKSGKVFFAPFTAQVGAEYRLASRLFIVNSPKDIFFQYGKKFPEELGVEPLFETRYYVWEKNGFRQL